MILFRRKYRLTFLFLLVSFLPIENYAQQSKLRTYGFFDFETEVSNKDAAGKRGTFDQHHLNVLMNYQLDHRFSVLSEMEWEHGPMHSPKESSGNIYLARAFLEYKYSDAFLIKVGKFMSPFGLYNERHDATPTFLFTFLPESVYGKKELSFGGKGRIFAKHSTGIQFLGNLFVSGWEGRYQIYVSNGRGPEESEKDNNANKGVGWRFVLSPPNLPVKFGASYYGDKNGNAYNAGQSALGLDFEADFSVFHLEGEYFLPKMEQVDVNSVPNGVFKRGKGYYLLAGYTLFNRLTPFIRYDFSDPDKKQNKDGEAITACGINYSITARVYFKNEVYFHRFQNSDMKSYETVVASVAVAF